MKMTVKHINLTEHFNVLQQLWETAFPEDSRFAYAFLSRAIPPAEGWCCQIGTQVTSMAFFLPAALHIGSQICSARYVYAVATLPAYRRQGCATALLRAAALKSSADVFCLHAATPQAARLYRSLGYRDLLYQKTVTADCLLPGSLLPDVSAQPFSAALYRACCGRYEKMTSVCRMEMPDKLLETLLQNAVLLTFSGGFALMQETENAYVLTETAAPDALLLPLLRTVQADRPDKPVIARLPGEQQETGMLLPLTKRGKSLTDRISVLPFSGPLFDI